MAAIHAVVVIRFRANQIISGLAINLLAIGICKFFLKAVFHSSSNWSRVDGLPALLQGLGDWPSSMTCWAGLSCS